MTKNEVLNPADRYAELERTMLDGRARGNLSEDAEEELSDEMTQLWHRMSAEEQDEANRRARERAVP